MTQTSASVGPTASSAGSGSGGGSDVNIGAIVGGVAGGVAGLVVLIWLILLPLRRRAKKAKEVEWLAFGQENDHVNESSAEAIYGRSGGGSGEGKGGSVANVNDIQMDEMEQQDANAYHYSNVDGAPAWPPAGGMYAQQPGGEYDAYYAQQAGYGDPHGQQAGYDAHGQMGAYQNAQWGGTYDPSWAAASGGQPTISGHSAGGGYTSPPLGPTSLSHAPSTGPAMSNVAPSESAYDGYSQQQHQQQQPARVDDRAGSPNSMRRYDDGRNGLHLANP